MAKKKPRGHAKALGIDQSELLSELQDIKKLLMVLALKIGTSTNELGAALGVTGQRIRQMVPAREIRKLKFKSYTGEGDE